MVLFTTLLARLFVNAFYLDYILVITTTTKITTIMKTYIDAQLQVVRVNNNDIVTASVSVGDPITGRNVTADAPDRRRSIWD